MKKDRLIALFADVADLHRPVADQKHPVGPFTLVEHRRLGTKGPNCALVEKVSFLVIREICEKVTIK